MVRSTDYLNYRAHRCSGTGSRERLKAPPASLPRQPRLRRRATRATSTTPCFAVKMLTSVASSRSGTAPRPRRTWSGSWSASSGPFVLGLSSWAFRPGPFVLGLSSWGAPCAVHEQSITAPVAGNLRIRSICRPLPSPSPKANVSVNLLRLKRTAIELRKPPVFRDERLPLALQGECFTPLLQSNHPSCKGQSDALPPNGCPRPDDQAMP